MSLHPVFKTILTSQLATMTPAHGPIYYPAVGRRRAYRSSGDAMSYEAGYLAFDDRKAPPAFRSPFADGWNDAAAAQDRRDEVALGLDCNEDAAESFDDLLGREDWPEFMR